MKIAERAGVFQFHYGTIKSLRPRSIINPYTQFQFHYGTIKSVIMCIYHALPLLFQFHYGTIKRQ